MRLKNSKEVARMRAAGRLVAECFAILEENIKPGITLQALDRLVEDHIYKQGAETLYKGYRGRNRDHPPFPGVICASVNNEICHGLPDGRILAEGDVIGIDIGLRLKGFCGDACVTYPVGRVSPRAERLLAVGREALQRGIDAAQFNNHLNDIGRAIEGYADTQGVSVVHEWGGHGIGRVLHEGLSVSHIRQPKLGPRLVPGMTFTIEPMINEGTHDWVMLPDGWTVITADGKLSVQFEHTVVITRDGPDILTLL
jgi:methionyl aminopeptidase